MMNHKLAFFIALAIISIYNQKSNAAEQKFIPMNNQLNYIVECSNDQEIKRWQPINDGVMGGLSQGKMVFIDEHCVFTGNISLENNGGFSSVYRAIQPLPKALDMVDIDITGDGAVYQLRMVVYVNGYRLVYKHDFTTSVGVRQRIQFNLSDFKASFRGRIIDDAPILKSENISETGFLLTQKEAKKFSLMLHRIEIYSATKNKQI